MRYSGQWEAKQYCYVGFSHLTNTLNMKNLQTLTLILLSTLFLAISCGDDDDVNISGTYEANSLDVDCPNDDDSFSTQTTATEDLCLTVGGVKTTAVVRFVFNGPNYTTFFIQDNLNGIIDTVQTSGVFDMNDPNSRVSIIGIDGEVEGFDGGDRITFEGVNGDGCDVTLELDRG